VRLVDLFGVVRRLHSIDGNSSAQAPAALCSAASRRGLIPDGWRVVEDDYGQADGKLQAESMMSTVASLFPQ
jgi:carbohydrate-binding DOMON domain-containing protein